MNEKKYTVLTVFLIFGLLLLAFAGAVGIFEPGRLSTEAKFEVIFLIQIILGSVGTTLAITTTRKGYQLYLGLLLFGWGLLTYLVARIFPFTIYEWWPVYGILASLFVLCDGLYIYKRMKLGFAFPAILIMATSILFLFFSFHVIKASFITIVLIAGPILVVGFVVFFVLILLAQKKTKKLILDDDPDAFDEENLLSKSDETL